MTDLTGPISRLFGACSEDETEKVLLPVIYQFTKMRLGQERAQKLFTKLGSKTWAIEDNSGTLVLGYLLDGQRNKAAFLRERVAYNKTLPRSQRRGAGSTDVGRLRRYLDKQLKKYRDVPLFAFLKKGGPDLADGITKEARDNFPRK
jgi:hypothetical protein